MKWISHLVVFGFGAFLFWATTSVRIVPNGKSEVTDLAIKAIDVTYSDFISVLLTVVTIVLAVVAVGVGVIAGYIVTTIKDDAREAVDVAVDKRLSGLSKDVADIAFQMGSKGKTVEELEADFDQEEMEER